MCGIAGIHHLRGEPVDPGRVRRMLAPIVHRGPDGQGAVALGGTALGHVRLSILDVSGGTQPMSNEDGSIWVTFNGEIFNYIELREELIRRGHRFATKSDTEVIVHLYEEEGEDCVRRFNGQWALAIWDARQSKLLVSRDRLGVRPLYYAVVGNELIFASEIKALFTHAGLPRRIDLVGLDQVFTFWSPLAPRTVFEGVSELPPAHHLIVRNGRIETRRYWQIDYRPKAIGIEDAADRLLELLGDAARIRLRSDVPVGAYLSGGLDSAVTAALVARSTNASLRTFSITFDDPAYDESAYQQRMVRHLGTDHDAIRCRGADIGRALPDVIRHTEKPILRTAPAAMYLLAGLVRREGYKVVLTGEGADEMLGGYDIFKEAKVRRFWARRPESARREALLGRLYPYQQAMLGQSLAYRKAFFHVRPGDLSDPLFSHLPRWELTSRLKRFFSEAVRAELAGRDPLGDVRALFPGEGMHPFCQAQHLETATLLPGYILSSQGDRMAMAHSVEGRFPFLDHHIAEFAAELPPRWKMLGLDEKHLLKRIADRLVPEAIVRRSKQPYRAPDAAALFGTAVEPLQLDYVDELLSPQRVRDDGLFDAGAVARLAEKFRARRAIGVKDQMALVGILSTQLLVEQFIHSPRPASVVSSRTETVPSLAPAPACHFPCTSETH
ncbi:MAG: asparagine synthase (glutamine-hydrolyzing) [Rhodopirellula sp.]|nr:asparagine synthase (glutamine-hydrolyzing) [Rhodopirellula sp.]